MCIVLNTYRISKVRIEYVSYRLLTVSSQPYSPSSALHLVHDDGHFNHLMCDGHFQQLMCGFLLLFFILLLFLLLLNFLFLPSVSPGCMPALMVQTMVLTSECLVALVAAVFLQACVYAVVRLQICPSLEALAAHITTEVAFAGMNQEMVTQC